MVRFFLLFIVLLVVLIFFSCIPKSKEKDDIFITTSGLGYKVIKEGQGNHARIGQEVLIHETMSYLNDSLLFDSRKLSHPVKVLIGGKQPIHGVDEGLVGI